MTDLLSLISQDTRLTRKAGTDGGEWAGPCPWCGGRDRFRVWPHPSDGKARYWCRQCGRKGDAVQYLRDIHGLSYQEACERLGETPTKPARAEPLPVPVHSDGCKAPGRQWQEQGRRFVSACQERLWQPEGGKALAWLTNVRGLTPETVRKAGLGYNSADRYEARESWGLAPGKRLWLPRGVVIPWWIGGELWRVNIRRPRGEPKYIQPTGGGPGLYGADSVKAGQPAMLLEGEISALTVQQHAGDLVAAVATGSTGGARRARWLAVLALAERVLVTFDADAAGDKAATYWLGVLPKSRRWRPLWSDTNDMARDGADIRGWVAAAVTGTSPNVWTPEALRERNRARVAALLAELESASELTAEEAQEAAYYRTLVSAPSG